MVTVKALKDGYIAIDGTGIVSKRVKEGEVFKVTEKCYKSLIDKCFVLHDAKEDKVIGALKEAKSNTKVKDVKDKKTKDVKVKKTKAK